MREVLIIGAGPAGVAAAVQLRRLGRGVRLVDRSGRAGGLVEQAWRVENHPLLPPTPGPQVAALLREHLARFGLRVERREVQRLRREGERWVAECSQGAVEAEQVVLACGTAPAPLWLADGTLIPDLSARALLAAGVPGRALVVGGGEAALDQALTLADAGVEVLVAVRGGSLRARGRLVAAVDAHPGVSVGYWLTLAAAEGRLRLSDGRWWDDPVLPAVGRVPLPLLDVLPGPALHLVGDAARGTLGQVGIAIGDGLAVAGRIGGSGEDPEHTGQ
ncbi:MAG: NAD(P)/FAD-dependent oxidoreductase [Deltaproteobacteria bacterium]|nr:NAD(P)/FAD-dependent oxidoreductase [Deltaproteobacteria bacterium]